MLYGVCRKPAMPQNRLQSRRGVASVFVISCLGSLGIFWTFPACSVAPPNEQLIAEEYDPETGQDLPEDTQHKLVLYAKIGPNSAAAPIGRFLLIRDGSKYCAVRFTFPRKSEEAPGEMFQAPGRSYYAEYQTYFQGDGSGDLRKSNVERKQGTVSGLPYGYWPLPRLAYERGNGAIRCGSERYRWFYPSGVQMTKGEELEFAPTRWADIHNVDVHAPNLIWYGRDKTIIEDIYIPLEELPGAPTQ